MPKLDDIMVRKASHVILYGDPKTGKSTLVGKLAEAGFNLLWFSFDNGHEVLRKLPKEARDKIEIFVIPDTKEFPVGITTCLKLVSGGRVELCHLHGQVSCSTCKAKGGAFSPVHLNALGLDTIVVFDHGSQIADSAMNFITQKEKDDYKPEWEDFRVQGELMKKFLGNIQQAPYHCIVLAHVIESVMEDGSKKLVPQLGTTNFSTGAGKYFDHMVYAHVMNASHKFGSATTYLTKVVTGSRTDVKIEENKEHPSLAAFFPFSEEKDNSDKNEALAILQDQAATTAVAFGSKSMPEVKTAATPQKAPVAAPANDKVAALLANLKK